MTAAATELLSQLFDPLNRADPYPILRQFLAAGPSALPAANLAVFSSFADCDEVLRHPDSCSDQSKSTTVQRAVAAGEDPRPSHTPGFLFLDPPDHTRLRRLVSKAFSPKVVKGLEPEIAVLVDGLLDDVAEAGRMEVIADLAYPLPVAVICRMLGVPIEDEPQFSSASALLAQGIDPWVTSDGQGVEERLQAGAWLNGYLGGLIERRRAHLGEDLISGLVAVEESGDQLTTDEIVATCRLLLIAGHETTVNLIANAVLAMLRDRRHWTALGRDAGVAPAIMEETLRYDPPVQLIDRIAGADMTIGEHQVRIPKGDTILLLIAAAQRDPAVIDRPNEFDPERVPVRHLAFGLGRHFCLGAPLARLEAAMALSAVTRRFPDARLVDEPAYKPHVTLRGMTSLDVGL